MLPPTAWLFDTTGFVPRKDCGDWPPGLIWLHVGSDLFIWLAYLSIPLILLYFVRRRRDLPFSRLFVLFALFILACGFTHLIEAVIFTYPVYRLSGVLKLLTALVSWATVISLVPAVPKVLEMVAVVNRSVGDTGFHTRLTVRVPSRLRDYIVAVLAGVLAILVRAALDSVLDSAHPYVVSLLAVVFVAWESGFGPALVTLAISAAGTLYWFVPPRGSMIIRDLPDQVGLGLFVFCGVSCAMLGEAQWYSRERAEQALDDSEAQRAGLEAEVAQRARVEHALRDRTAELAASEERFRTLAEAVPPVVWGAKPDGALDYLNPRWTEFTGAPAAEGLGGGWLGFVHPDDRERVAAGWAAAAANGGGYEAQYRLRRHDGGYEWFLVRATPQRDLADNVLRWFGTYTNIHQTRQLQDRLQQSLDRFQALTESVPQFVWTCQADGSCDYLSRQWVAYTGVPEAKQLGTGWVEAVHPDDREAMAVAWRGAVAAGAGYDAEFRIRRHDGAYRWFKTRAVPVRDETGAVVKWVGTNTDIEDQKRQEETLEAMVRERTTELHRSNRELEQFAYVASHDLQEPLRKIQAFGDLLAARARDKLPDDGLDFLHKMQRSAGRMRRLIDDLLTYSRVTTQARPFARVDLGAVLRDVVEVLEVRIEQTGGSVEVGPLPEVEADPGQMRHLFQNLIANALKFHRPNVPPVIRVTAEPAEPGPDPAAYRVTVADNGIGFDEKYLGRIFQIFQRLHGRDEFEGSGIGLAICKKIVERHGGTITAASRPGEGAAFTVTLPARQPVPTTADVPDAPTTEGVHP